jgi:spermidine synthase
MQFMPIYAGTFLLALVMLAFEITLTRILSVTSWYHLAFFAISTAMLGMTAGATTVYLYPGQFSSERLRENLARACLRFSLAVPLALVVICLVPASPCKSIMPLFGMLALAAACALPFYYAGTAVSLVLTKCNLPVGRVYASDLVGASAGCFLVLGGLEVLDAPSLILLCASIGALAGFIYLWNQPQRKLRTANIVAFVFLGLAAIANSRSAALIRPLVVKNSVEPASKFDIERWNSFSRIAVYPVAESVPQLWGRSPVAPQETVNQRLLNIDGEAATSMREYRTESDIEHLRYDVVNIAHYLRPHGPACIIGVGGGRDIQSALLFGHSKVLGVEINPIFINLLQNQYRQFANIADRKEVTLVTDEARSYLSRNDAKFSFLQMSLIDTWASTGAGAMTLSENSLYTVEAWRLFIDRLADDGVFTVSRWYGPANLGETGRLVSLAVEALLLSGAERPSDHLALVTSGKCATLIVSRRPLTPEDNEKLVATCKKLGYSLTASPVTATENQVLRDILSCRSREELRANTRSSTWRLDAPTDEEPYFFNMLRLEGIPDLLKHHGIEGVQVGNLYATITLLGLILALAVLTVATILVPLILRNRIGEAAADQPSILWAGAFYFSLIGCGFMLLEIAMIQRLSVFLGHPVYALGVLLFAIILSTGIGSFLSEQLPLTRMPWALLYPAVACAAILVTRFVLAYLTKEMVPAPMSTKIVVSIAAIFPVGVVLGFFFPAGMRLVRSIHPQETPWYWALNGIFGVLSSAVAVFISIFLGISINFYLSAICYALVLVCVLSLLSSRKHISAGI